MKRLLFTAIAVSSLTLAGVGPIPLTLDVNAPVDLTTITKTPLKLGNGTHAATFSYSRGKISLGVAGEKVLFRGAKRDDNTVIFSKFSNSKQITEDGDRVGIRLASAGKELLDEESSTREQSCTWTERVRRWRCVGNHSHHDHWGHHHHGCHWRWVWVDEIHHGHRDVTTTTRTYLHSYEGSIATEKAGKVATLTGQRELSESSRSYGSCR